MNVEPTPPGSQEPVTATTQDAAAFPTQPVSPTASVARPRRRAPSAGMLNAVLILAAAVAIGGVAFAIGRGTAPAAAAGGLGGADQFEAGNGFGGGAAENGGAGHSGAPDAGGVGDRFGQGGGLTVAGTVESVSGDTLTVTTTGGRTVVVSFGSGTTYRSVTSATAADVTVGSKVEVQLSFGVDGQPSASGAGAAPIGTASSVTVVP